MTWLITPQQKTDPDALAYLAEVERADGQALESGVTTAVINFVAGCKADGIWNAIKASCILAGARTLKGALVPLVGPAPTNVGNGFVSGDYNRKTGLIGNGSTKYLNSNYQFASVSSNRDNNHISYWRATGDTGTCVLAVNYDSSNNYIINNSGARNFHANTSGLAAPDSGLQTGFRGITRNSSASYSYRGGGLVSSLSIASVSNGVNRPFFVFARNNGGTVDSYASGRMSFYSIGESLDLALLDARVTTLVNAIAAAIP